MGRKTSVYLSDEALAAWKASGVPLAEIIDRGLGAESLDERRLHAVAVATLDGAEDRLRDLAREICDETVKAALRHGGGYQ